MARVTIYLPDEVAAQARAAGLNISGLTQDAIADELARASTDVWLDQLERLPCRDIAHEDVIAALDHARSEFGAS